MLLDVEGEGAWLEYQTKSADPAVLKQLKRTSKLMATSGIGTVLCLAAGVFIFDWLESAWRSLSRSSAELIALVGLALLLLSLLLGFASAWFLIKLRAEHRKQQPPLRP